MKTLIILVLVAVIGWLVLKERPTVPTVEPAQTTVEATPSPSPTPTEAPSAEASVTKEEPLEKLPPTAQVYDFKAVVIQQLDDGLALLEVQAARKMDEKRWQGVWKNMVLLTRGESLDIPDETPVRFFGLFSGTYQYTSVDGSLRTVSKLLYIPKELLPDAQAAPPRVVSTPRPIFPPGIDTPDQRRAYLQQQAAARKQKAGQVAEERFTDRGY